MISAGRRTLRPMDAPGTDEADWQAWPGLARLPALELCWVRSAVVVSPHPVDEVLGFGGGLGLLAETGTRIRIVAVTEGEASHPESPTTTQRDMVRIRRTEREEALDELGASSVEVVRMGLPDGKIAGAEAELALRLSRLFFGFHICVAPWEGDLHPDYAASGRAAATAANAAGMSLFHYPVWMWHWAEPGAGGVPWHLANRIELPDHIRLRKTAAIECFTSQIAPLSGHAEDAAGLKPEMLAHFTRTDEVVFR